MRAVQNIIYITVCVVAAVAAAALAVVVSAAVVVVAAVSWALWPSLASKRVTPCR